MLIEKLKFVMQIFRLKIGPPFPLIAMEMEDQFSNEKSALGISTFQLASKVTRGKSEVRESLGGTGNRV